MVSFGMEAAEGPAFVVVELLVVTRQIVQILKSYQKIPKDLWSITHHSTRKDFLHNQLQCALKVRRQDLGQEEIDAFNM